jgi:hypothetical protein
VYRVVRQTAAALDVAHITHLRYFNVDTRLCPKKLAIGMEFAHNAGWKRSTPLAGAATWAFVSYSRKLPNGLYGRVM